jgi:hypothetical protein
MSEKKAVSPFVGRKHTVTSARRFVNVQRDRALLRLWRGAPDAVSYLFDVIKGKATYEEGKYKSCLAILSRCIPTVTSQTVVSDATSISASVVVGDGKAVADGVGGDLRAKLERLERHQEMMRAVRGEVTDVTVIEEKKE